MAGMRTAKAALVTVVVGGVMGGAAAAALSDSADAALLPPPNPPWGIQSDGLVTKLPRSVPLVDSSGHIVGHVDPYTYVNDWTVGETDETPVWVNLSR